MTVRCSSQKSRSQPVGLLTTVLKLPDLEVPENQRPECPKDSPEERRPDAPSKSMSTEEVKNQQFPTMKVENVSSRQIHPEDKQSHEQSSLLPVLDAWYAYHRPLATIYLFEACPGQDRLVPNLTQSMSRALRSFPQYAGNLEKTAELVDGFQRTRVVWGGNEPGVQFLESRTNARLRSLLPPPAEQTSAFIWNRSGSSLKPLFPPPMGATSAMRVQVTTFGGGGFSLGIDIDHGLADAHAVGLFMGYW